MFIEKGPMKFVGLRLRQSMAHGPQASESALLAIETKQLKHTLNDRRETT